MFTDDYFKLIGIYGPSDDPDCVRIWARPGGIAVSCQDRAIVTLQNLSLVAGGTGSVGFAGRGACIGDVAHVHYGNFEGGHHNSFASGSILNCIAPVRIDGPAETFVSLHAAEAHLDCQIVFKPVHFQNAFVACKDGSVYMSGAKFAYRIGDGITGKQFSMTNCVFEKPAARFPGSTTGTADAPSIIRKTPMPAAQ